MSRFKSLGSKPISVNTSSSGLTSSTPVNAARCMKQTAPSLTPGNSEKWRRSPATCTRNGWALWRSASAETDTTQLSESPQL